MKNRHSVKLRMYITVKEFTDLLNGRATGTPMLGKVKNELDELVGDIHDRMLEANISTEGLTQTKSQLRENLIAKTLVLAGCLRAYASIHGNPELAQLAGNGRSEFSKAKEVELALLIKPVIEAIKAHLEALAEYGVTAESVTDLETSLDEFQACIGGPREVIARRGAAIKSLDQLFKDTDILLKERLDPLMLRFEYSDPQLYQNYLNARVIVD